MVDENDKAFAAFENVGMRIVADGELKMRYNVDDRTLEI